MVQIAKLIRKKLGEVLVDEGLVKDDQIQEVLRGWEESRNAPAAMGRVRAMYEEKLRETSEQIERLGALQEELRTSLQYLGTCGTCDPVHLITACSCCEQHDEAEAEPDLVAGLHSQSART